MSSKRFQLYKEMRKGKDTEDEMWEMLGKRKGRIVNGERMKECMEASHSKRGLLEMMDM